MNISIVIRTLNESKYLDELISNIEVQETEGFDIEIILVDSGSTDGTLKIAKSHNCKIVHITRKEFSFGLSLNRGCEKANGEILVMISGHCVPVGNNWLQLLCKPLIENKAVYSYGRQVGGSDSYYSECRIFNKYYPTSNQIPQEGFYCNNANSAIKRIVWEENHFDEELTGLEDMELAKRLVKKGEKIAYCAEATVYHYHEELWSSIKLRFERESIALQEIMPQVHISKSDLIRYLMSSIWMDLLSARKDGLLITKAIEIVQYRFYQYWGSYVGNHEHRKLSHTQKEEYFFPK